MKHYRIPFFFLVLVLSITACQKDNLNDASELEHRSSIVQVNSIPELKPWFFSHLNDIFHDQTTTNEFLNIVSPRWDEQITWNDSTIVIPCNHFVPDEPVGYTRLFLQHDSSGKPSAYFYSIFPEDQAQIQFTTGDIQFFNGRMITYDLVEGYKDQIIYSSGKPHYYMDGEQIVTLRCPGCPRWWLGPEYTDGTGAGEPAAESGGGGLPMIGCDEPCPNGHSPDKCRHPRDCNGGGGGDIIIYIPGKPGWLIHNNGTGKGGGLTGGGGSGGGPVDQGNSDNPLDEAGIDEIILIQLQNLLCWYIANHPSPHTCEELMDIVSIYCLEVPNPADCIEAAIDNNNDDDDPDPIDIDAECQNAMNLFTSTFGLSLSHSERFAIQEAVTEAGIPCGDDEAFNEVAIETLIELILIEQIDYKSIDFETTSGQEKAEHILIVTKIYNCVAPDLGEIYINWKNYFNHLPSTGSGIYYDWDVCIEMVDYCVDMHLVWDFGPSGNDPNTTIAQWALDTANGPNDRYYLELKNLNGCSVCPQIIAFEMPDEFVNLFEQIHLDCE